MVKHPILFETFARPQYAREVFDAIKRARPQTLYFYCNKAREDRPDEITRNNEIKSWVKEIDWSCDLHTWFREEYVDVYTSLIGSKEWILKTEDCFICLEDDCVPSTGFFEFCDHYLDVYKNDERVGFITGNNYAQDYSFDNNDHLLTRSLHHYGWATWKNRWESIDFQMVISEYIRFVFFREYFSNDFYLALYYYSQHVRTKFFIEQTRCWDILFTLWQIRHKWLTVTPAYNLVTNVGLIGEHNHNAKKGIYHTISNGDNMAHYVFSTREEKPVLDYNYDRYESKSEGLRNWWKLIWENIMFIIRYPIKRVLKCHV